MTVALGGVFFDEFGHAAEGLDEVLACEFGVGGQMTVVVGVFDTAGSFHHEFIDHQVESVLVHPLGAYQQPEIEQGAYLSVVVVSIERAVELRQMLSEDFDIFGLHAVELERIGTSAAFIGRSYSVEIGPVLFDACDNPLIGRHTVGTLLQPGACRSLAAQERLPGGLERGDLFLQPGFFQ